MVEKIVSFALNQRLIVLLLAVALAGWGYASFLQLPIEAYPDIMDTQVSLISQWPGHAAEEMEQQITIPVETAVNGIPGLSVMRSRSLFGLSIVYLNFETGVTDEYARNQVVQRLQGVNLPPGVAPQMSPQSSATGEIYRYTLVAPPGYPLAKLKELEDWTLEREFKTIPGVVDVNSFGGLTKRYEIILDPDRLRANNLTLAQVEQALASNNANAGGNYIERGSESYVVRGIGLYHSVEDIADTVIAEHNGVPILAKDLGVVHIGHKTRLGKVGINDTDDTVEGIVLLLRGANADAVLDKLHEKVRQLNSSVLPTEVKIVPLADRTDLMHTTTHTVEHNLFMGISLVIVVLLVFLGNARAALIAAVTIPLSLLFAFGIMHLEGISANLLSIGAVDFGIIVDGALIMVENIFRHLSEHHVERDKVADVVAAAAKEVQSPIFFSVTIIITAYLPLLTMESVERKMFTPMAITIGCALLGALLLSLTLAPVLCTYLLRGPLHHGDNIVTRTTKNLYNPALSAALKFPKVTLAAALVMLVCGLTLGSRLGSEFMPHLDEGNLWIRASMPSTISYSAATRLVRQMRAVIHAHPAVLDVLSQDGRPDDGTDAVGFDDAEFFTTLKPEAERPHHMAKEEIIHELNAQLSRFPNVDWNFSQLIEDNVEEAMTGVKGELAVKIFGSDLNVLTQKASGVEAAMRHVPGITDVGIFDELGEPQITIIPDRAACARYGINVADVQDMVQTAIGGNAVTTFLEGAKQFDVVVRFQKAARNSLEAIQSLPISTPDGFRLPLSQVAKVQYSTGAAFIYREAGERFIAVKFGVRDRDLGGAVAAAQRAVASQVTLPTGYSLQWGGEFENMERAKRKMMVVIPLSIVVILLLLYIAFNNLRHALLILLNIPFAVVGGIFALYITHFSLSVSAAVGFISVFGVAVLNGVILISSFNQLRAEHGYTLAHAVREGAMLRLRPVLMSALLAILGLVPAATSTGIGSDVQKPLAIVVIGGLMTGTGLTLLVLPVLYMMIESRIRGTTAAIPQSNTLHLQP
ncbi:MAG: efflux RND transporter permease subunit [Abitibacteriaceae bacterium]|nr:efflux RND transporter permease subunit [Abditibacteriaceae bacterium]